MNVVIPFHPGDQDQAQRLLRWIAELGKNEATCFLCCSAECAVLETTELAKAAFEKVEWIQDYEKVKCDWQSADRSKPRSASGANSLFRQTAQYFHHHKLGPFLWLEPDAVPLCKTWLTDIDLEYSLGRKPFMGMKVIGNNPDGNMSGVAVYPENACEIMEGAMLAVHIPFDVVKPKDVNPNSYFTTRIVHQFQAPTFVTQEDFEARVPKDALIYHACKDGSIYNFLRNNGAARVHSAVGTERVAPPYENGGRVVGFGNPSNIKVPTPSIEVSESRIPETWIGQVRALTTALASMNKTPANKQSIQTELKKAGLIRSKSKR